ncbi:MAG: Hpt domain-containing protein, partial [Candidatus Woesearchaeota archaeon]
MDMTEYKKEFISEARDHADFLNEGLLTLEHTPEDEDNINKLFRSFHTLKGNAAAMGFMKFSELAHSLEDLLTKVRDKEIPVSKELIDVLLEGVDFLEQGLTLIDEDNSEALEPESAMNSVKKLLGVVEQKTNVTIDAKKKYTTEEQKELNEEKQKGLTAFRTIISFDAKNILKTAKSLLIIRDLTNNGRILSATPSLDDIKQGKFEDKIDITFTIKGERDDALKIINKVSGLKEVQILGLDEEYKQKEEDKKDITNHSNKTNNTTSPPNQQNIQTNNKSQEKKPTTQTESVKVDMTQLDLLMNLVGELLISNIRLKDIDAKKDFDNLKTVVTGIDRLIMDLKDEVMEIRMLPIGHIFNRYP